MLHSSARFHGYGSLRYVYKNAKALRSRLITLKTVENPYRNTSRFSIVVSKKVHKSAVGRNRIRRRLYEIIRHELPAITTVHDVVVIVTSGETLMASHQELREALIDLLVQADIIDH